MTTVTNAQEAVGVAASESVNAAYQKTFAVGGAIIDNATKKIIAAMHNNVLMPYPPASGTTRFLPHDPTAPWRTATGGLVLRKRRRTQTATCAAAHDRYNARPVRHVRRLFTHRGVQCCRQRNRHLCGH